MIGEWHMQNWNKIVGSCVVTNSQRSTDYLAVSYWAIKKNLPFVRAIQKR